MPSLETGESIYALIPERQIVPPKPPMHRSKHDGTVNSGKFPLGVPKREKGTFGPQEGTYKPKPVAYMKKHIGEPVLPDPQAPTKPKDKVKASVPGRTDKPIMGLVSAKNFVTANAVENILAQPKRAPQEPALATQRADFGKVPGYLKTVKKRIDQENTIVAEFNNRMAQQQQASQSAVKKMSEDERQDLIVVRCRYQAFAT